MKAIPTEYNGITFRSKLEAKYAKHFDEAGIKFLYEIEGYQLPKTWYLPDFFLPDLNWFPEVKGPHHEREQKPFELAKAIVSTEWRTPFSAEFSRAISQLGLDDEDGFTARELKEFKANVIETQVAIGDVRGQIRRLVYDHVTKDIFPMPLWHLNGYICPKCGAYNHELGECDNFDYFSDIQCRTPHDGGYFCWRCHWTNSDEETVFPRSWSFPDFINEDYGSWLKRKRGS